MMPAREEERRMAVAVMRPKGQESDQVCAMGRRTAAAVRAIRVAVRNWMWGDVGRCGGSDEWGMG